MLSDARSQSLVTNFAGQWLYLRNLPSVDAGSAAVSRLRRKPASGLRRETELFFESILREDRSVARAADGRLHVRQRTAGAALRHSQHLRRQFRRVDGRPTTPSRAARPGQHPDRDLVSRTGRRRSLRGKWILENVLGTPPPPPPPNVPALEEQHGERQASARCASGWSSIAPIPSARAVTR